MNESNACLLYILKRYGGDKLQPAAGDAAGWADYYNWLFRSGAAHAHECYAGGTHVLPILVHPAMLARIYVLRLMLAGGCTACGLPAVLHGHSRSPKALAVSAEFDQLLCVRDLSFGAAPALDAALGHLSAAV